MSTVRNIAALLALVGTVVLLGRLHIVRGELEWARADLAVEKAEHGKTAAMISDCAQDLLEVHKHLEEKQKICNEEGAAYLRRAEMLFRCEEKICGNSWVPYEQYSLCLNRLWDLDPAGVEHLEMVELETARKQNDRDARSAASGISYVPVSQYDRCVGLLQTCDDHDVVGSRSLVDELNRLEEN